MSALQFDHVSFAYADTERPVLLDACLEVAEGAFALLTGATGSGKSTLLRLAKPELAPKGKLRSAVRVFGSDASALGVWDSARAVGYVSQSPDAQMACDTVWHEMAFGLENLGVPEPEMRRRVAETCNFLGIEPWFRMRVSELSGGQRQILALAAALAMRPRLLLLDEPTSMLDPVAEKNFLSLLFRANRELGITVVVATHAPHVMADYATCAFALEDGRVRETPLDDVRSPELCDIRLRPLCHGGEAVLCLEDVWYRYDRDGRWVLRALDLEVRAGEVRALVGSNGCGKSTLLQLAAGVIKPRRGRARNALASGQALLPQSPKALLACETVLDELMEWSRGGGYGRAEAEAALATLGLAEVPDRHPYDLSGGQHQLLALEKLLLVKPRLLLLDEPTKGLDRPARERMARRLAVAASDGATVLFATHDMAFVNAVAGSVSLMFDGGITVTEPTDEFLRGSWLYSNSRNGSCSASSSSSSSSRSSTCSCSSSSSPQA